MKIKIHQSYIVIGLLTLITCNILLPSSNTYNNSNLTQNESLVSSASLGTELSPFFDHLEEDMELYLQLNNTVDTYSADYFYHAFTNNPEFTISNNTHFARDLIYFLMGFANSITDVSTIEYSGTPLWDSSNGGFYSKVDGSLTTISSEKKVFDNLLYILALLEGTEYSTDTASVVNKITSQWNDVVGEFWDNTNDAFNHSNSNLEERYSADNFLGAIVAYSIAKSSLFTQSFRNSVKLYGDDIMADFDADMYDGISGQEGYYNTSDISNNKIGTNNKNLLTNAMGILALLEWNIQNGYEVDSVEVGKAEKIWRFLNTKLFNGASDLYITETNFDGNIAIDSDMYLLQNAWMMKASLELFKHTGNTTYYEGALDNFNGMEQNLYDQTNNGYNSLVGSSEKTLDSYGMLLNSIYDFQKIFTESEVIAVLNQSEYIYEIDSLMKFTLSYNITMQISHPAVGESWSISAPIENADINYVLRYLENDTIVSTDTSTTNATGQDEFTYDLSTLSSFYDYKLDVRCNRTGFNAGIDTLNFPLTAGIEIVDIKQLETPLHQGDTISLNVTYTSSRPDNVNATTKTTGENFELQSSERHIILREDEIDGKFESSVVVEVTAKQEAELGIQQIDIIVLNNDSKAIFSEEYELEIFSVVEVSSILVNQYLVNFVPTDLMFTFYNHHFTQNESITVEVNSTVFDYSNTVVVDILPRTYKGEEIPLIPNEMVKMGTLEFTITIWRDENVIFTQNLTIEAVPEIEILNIYSGELQVIQGQAPTVTLQLYNYNSSSKQLYVNSNGVQVSDKIVSPGEYRFTVEIGNKIRNPYNLGEEIYLIEIKDDLGNVLASKVITVQIKPSTLNIFLFYVIPILIPVGVIVYFKYKELEQIKRTK